MFNAAVVREHIENGVIAQGDKGPLQQQDHNAVMGRAGESGTQGLSQPSQYQGRLLFDRLQLSSRPPSACPLPSPKLPLLRGGTPTLGLAPLCSGGRSSVPCPPPAALRSPASFQALHSLTKSSENASAGAGSGGGSFEENSSSTSRSAEFRGDSGSTSGPNLRL